MPIFRKRKSKTTAPAVIYFTQAVNEKKQKQLCVFGECTYSGRRFGPIWSHTPSAVSRCLCELSKICDCGRAYHKQRYTEGIRILPKT